MEGEECSNPESNTLKRHLRGSVVVDTDCSRRSDDDVIYVLCVQYNHFRRDWKKGQSPLHGFKEH